jgi:hypothetical protein
LPNKAKNCFGFNRHVKKQLENPRAADCHNASDRTKRNLTYSEHKANIVGDNKAPAIANR